jgi:Uma2 family endonuclease
MALTSQKIEGLSGLPWRNNFDSFLWIPEGEDGGSLLYLNKNGTGEESETIYACYVLPTPGTVEEYMETPEGVPLQLIHGKWIFMACPTRSHQEVEMNLSVLIGSFVKKYKLGKVYSAPFDVILNIDTVIQPDLLFVHKNRLDIIRENGLHDAPDFATEIISPSTQERDEEVKLQLLSEYGTVEYWIIHPTEKWIKQYVRENGKEELILKKVLEHEEDFLEAVAIAGLTVRYE